MHKPTLAQHAAFIVRNMNGDAEWLRDDFYTLQAFVCKYLNFHRHKATRLFYWELMRLSELIMIPVLFIVLKAVRGSIFLNALMYRELQAMAYLAGCLNLDDIAVSFEKEVAV